MTNEDMKDQTMYSYEFPIGDWSSDGHGKFEKFTVNSPAPIQAIVKAHRSCGKTLEFDIGDICGEYEEYLIDETIMEILKASGIWDWFKDLINDDHFFDVNDDEDGFCIQEPELLLQLWITILNFLDPELKLEYHADDKIESLEGLVDVPGYGLFSL